MNAINFEMCCPDILSSIFSLIPVASGFHHFHKTNQQSTIVSMMKLRVNCLTKANFYHVLSQFIRSMHAVVSYIEYVGKKIKRYIYYKLNIL